MKIRYFFLILFLYTILLQGCGYEPIYSSKNFLFKINKISFEKNKINNQIAKNLKSMSNENATKILDLNLKSEIKKKVVSKNKSGDPVIFELTLLITIETEYNKKIFINKQVYNNRENKFELNEFEIQMQNQIIKNIIDDILIYLSKF